jgi:bacillithiol biosynthesis cysteine-adding enzyme BshC
MNKILNRSLYNTFYHDYISEKSGAHEFIDSPHENSWDKLIPTLELDSERYQKTREILIKQNNDLTSEKAKIHLNYLSVPESVILITGQQLGIFASPIYTIYKIISTIKLTERLNQQINNYKFIPVFWLETEDHDFREINHIGLPDKNLIPTQYTYKGKDRGKVSIRHYKLDTSIKSFLAEIKDNLLETEFTQDLFIKLNNSYKPDKDWLAAIRDFLKDIFNPYGLLFFQPGDKEIKESSVDFFSELILRGKELRNAFNNQSDKLIAKGYINQVKNIPGQTFIHIEQENQQREHLYQEGNSYYFRDSDKKFSREDILSKINIDPISISSTVVSRPLLQSWLLPVVAYIAGPGEIAYWAQLGQMFPELNLVMPALYPRISATIIEPKIARYLQKYSPDIDQMPQKRDIFIEDYFKIQNENKGRNPINKLLQLLEDESGEVESYLKTLDPTIVGVGNKSIERMKQTLSNLESRVIKVQEEKEKQLTNHLNQIHRSIFPDEMPQERFQSLIYFLNKFGPGIIDRFVTGLDSNRFNHQLLYL